MRRTIRKLLLVICLCALFVPCMFFTTEAASTPGESAEGGSAIEDYGFSINGVAITSANDSGVGYSYVAVKNELTLTGDFVTDTSVTYASPDKYAVRKDYVYRMDGGELIYYIPTIDLSGKDSITILIDGEVSIGKSGEGRRGYASSSGTLIKSYGIYGENCEITILPVGNSLEKLNIETTDTAIYCKKLSISGRDVGLDVNLELNLDTYDTSAIYTVRDNCEISYATVTVDTDNLGSLYKSWNSSSDYKNDKGIYRYDSIAAVYVGYDPDLYEYSSPELKLGHYATLNVNASASGVKDSFRELSSEIEGFDNDKSIPVYKDGQWKTYETEDVRVYCGIFANGCSVVVYDSALNVNLKAGNLTSYFNGLLTTGTRYLYRTIGVNMSYAHFGNASVNVNMFASNSNETFAFGHDTHAFYSMRYYTHDGQEGTYYAGDASIAFDYEDYIQVRIDQRYSNDPVEHKRLVNSQSRMSRTLCWENSGNFRCFTDDYYMIKQEYDEIRGELCLFRSVKVLKENSAIYLRENGDSYQYSNYYDFRDATDLSEYVIDIEEMGWEEKDIYVYSGEFDITPAKSGIVLTVYDEAYVKIELEGGISLPYTGKIDIRMAGNVRVEGDGYMTDLSACGIHLDVIEGYRENELLTCGKLILVGGTAETGSIAEDVYVAMQGGNYRFSNEKITTFVEYNGKFNYSQCAKYTVDLGEYSHYFEYSNFVTSGGYGTGGIYPIDGVLYFWNDPNAALTFEGNPISFHHFTYDDGRGYNSYVFPRASSDKSKYTVYRIEDRLVIKQEGPSNYYVQHGEKNLKLTSFYFVRVCNIPGDNPFNTNPDSLIEIEIPGTQSRTIPSGSEVQWGCFDKDNMPVFLTREQTLSVVIDSIDYKTMSDYHGYYCRLLTGNHVDARYEFNICIITFDDPTNQIVGVGESAHFNIPYRINGNWVEDDGFVCSWEWRKNESDTFKPITGSEGETYDYTAFFNSIEDNSHGYQFRRVVTLKREGKDDIKFCSEPVTLLMGAKVVSEPTPKSIVLYTTDSRETLSFSVKYVRGASVTVLKGVGTTFVTVDGVELSYSTDADGVTTVTVTFRKEKFCDAEGNWDPEKLHGVFSLQVHGEKLVGTNKELQLNDNYSSGVDITVQEKPKFTSTPVADTVLAGGDLTVSVNCENLLCDDENSSMWWEYSKDGGTTWIKVTETDSSKAIYIYNQRGIDITIGVIGSNSSGYKRPTPYMGTFLYIKGISADMNGALVRAVMKDGTGNTCYSATATLDVIPFPQIAKQPQSRSVNLVNDYAIIDFTFDGDIPSGLTVTYQWQKRYTKNDAWANFDGGATSAVNDNMLAFNDLASQDEKAYYRCVITVVKDGKTFTITTDEAELVITQDVIFAGYTLTLDGTIGLNFYTILSNEFKASENAKIQFTIDNITRVCKVSDAYTREMDGVTYHIFSVPVYAYQMNLEVLAEAFHNGKNVADDLESIRSYATYIIKNASDYNDADVAFAKALLNYGAAAQNQFDANKDDLANKDLTDADKTVPELGAADLSQYRGGGTPSDAIGCVEGWNLVLGSKTCLNIYFTPADGIDIDSIIFKIDGKVVDYESAPDGYRIPIKNIKAWELDRSYIFTAELDDGTTVTYECSAMSYCYNVLCGGVEYEQSLIDLVCALREYNLKSEIYGGQNA